MKTLLMTLALVILPISIASANDAIHIKDPYMFETKSSMPAAAIFMEVMNHGDTDDKMIDFKTDAAERVEMHTMTHENDIMKMRRVDAYDAKAGESVMLDPMGNHIMVFGLKKDAVAGDTIDATAVFENAGEVPVTVTVKTRGEAPMDHMNHH